MTANRRAHVFIALWTLAVIASVCAFVLHLALRGRTVALGYELGRSRAEQARLREVKRVLQVEAASYKTPERVEIVARTLLGMEAPAPDRIVSVGGAPLEKDPPGAVGSSEARERTETRTDGPAASLPRAREPRPPAAGAAP
jgi:cell division protein FtsL